jgi:sugar phosphate isomerase/epimerase
MALPFDPQLGLVCTGLRSLERLEELGLRRFELVIVEDEGVTAAKAAAARPELTFGIHAPLFRNAEYFEPPLKACVLDPDAARRELAVGLALAELDQAAAWGARYTVLHLQRAVLMNSEPVPDGWGEEEGLEIAVEVTSRLLEHADEIGMPVHFENIMASPIFYSPASYLRLCVAVPGVRYCLDIGHLALDAAHFGFDLVEGVAALAPHTSSMHLYNNQIDDEIEWADLRESGKLCKFPVHPSQSPGHSWMPVGRALRRALSINPELLLTFEVYFRLEASHQLTLEGIEWVSQILSDSRASA